MKSRGASAPERILVEYGSGASVKDTVAARLARGRCRVYSDRHLSNRRYWRAKGRTSKAYPQSSDFPCLRRLHWHRSTCLWSSRTGRDSGFFPGSTIGNLDHSAAVEFLKRRSGSLRSERQDVDRCGSAQRRDNAPCSLRRSQGVTAQFNLNILRVLNREYNASFRIEEFAHRAIWNNGAGRIEMHLVSKCRQSASSRFNGRAIRGRRTHRDRALLQVPFASISSSLPYERPCRGTCLDRSKAAIQCAPTQLRALGLPLLVQFAKRQRKERATSAGVRCSSSTIRFISPHESRRDESLE